MFIYGCIYLVFTMKETIIGKIWKTGNSFVLTVPERLMTFAGWKEGDIIKVLAEKKVPDKK